MREREIPTREAHKRFNEEKETGNENNQVFK
jgi:hypothetical protein